MIDWNLRPRVRGRGSAIFLHVAAPDYAPTEGCVAVTNREIEWLYKAVKVGTPVFIVRA